MGIKLTFPHHTSLEALPKEALERKEVQERSNSIQRIQAGLFIQIEKTLQGILGESLISRSAILSLRPPEKIIVQKKELQFADQHENPFNISHEEYELMKQLLSLKEILSSIDQHQKKQKEKKEAADSARMRLSRITTALNNKGLEISTDELTEETFQDELKKQAPTTGKEIWEAPLQGIWKQHKNDIPVYHERIKEASESPSKEEMERLLQVDPETKEQMKKLFRRLSENPEGYPQTIGDLRFLVKKFMEDLSKKMKKLGIVVPTTSAEWSQLQSFFQERISYTIEKLPEEENENKEERTPGFIGRRAFIALALATAAGLYVLKNNTSPKPKNTSAQPPQPSPIKLEATPISTVESDLLYPEYGTALSAKTDLTLRSRDPLFQPLIDELNTLRQNGLRKVKEWQPLIDNGNIILYYPDAENTVEDFLKSFPQLTRVTPETLRIFSLVCTDGLRNRENREMLFDAYFELVVGENGYIVVKDPNEQSVIPEDRIITPYKIFELKSDGQLILALRVQRNERNNPHLLEIIGTINHKTIEANVSLRADIAGNETSEIVGVISGILNAYR